MTLDAITDELRTIAKLQDELPSRRLKAVANAREAGMTWRAIAAILGMTEHGLIKAAKNAPPP